MAMADVEARLVERVHNLIADEGTLANLGRHPLVQVFEDWMERAYGMDGSYRITLNEADLLLARDLLDQYRARHSQQVAIVLAQDITGGWHGRRSG